MMFRNQILYLSGIFTSQLGTHLFLIAMVIWFKQNFESSIYISYFLFSSAIASLICSPFSGVWVDRFDSKNIMIITDIISGMNMIIISFIMFNVIETIFNMELILALTFVNSVMSTLFTPASLTVVGQIAADDTVKKILSLSSNLTEISRILGRVIAGVLAVMINPAILILANGISFLVSAALESNIKIINESEKKHTQRSSYFQQLSEGFDFLKKHKVLLTLFIGASGTNFFMAINAPLLPIVIKDIFGFELWWYGVIMSATGVGAIIGGYIARKINNKISWELFLSSLIFQGLPFVFVPLAKHPIVLFLLMMMFGLFYVFVQIHLLALVNKVVPPVLRGRVFSLMFTIVGLFLPLSYIVSGYVGSISYSAIFNLYYIAGIFIPGLWVFAIYKIRTKSVKELVIGAHGG